MSLTRQEAKAVLAELEHLTIGHVLPNTDLINALICLKQIATHIPDEEKVRVMFEVDGDNKVTAIKAYRILTDTGLKAAKDVVDTHWVSGWTLQTIPVGTMTRSEFERRASDLEKDVYLRGRIRLHAPKT